MYGNTLTDIEKGRVTGGGGGGLLGTGFGSAMLTSQNSMLGYCGNHTKNWGEHSNKTLLTETQINLEPTIWAPDYSCQRMKSNMMDVTGTRCDQNYWRETGLEGGLIIHPPSKFAFCMFAKNGCSQWSTTVLAKLYHNNVNINR